MLNSVPLTSRQKKKQLWAYCPYPDAIVTGITREQWFGSLAWSALEDQRQSSVCRGQGTGSQSDAFALPLSPPRKCSRETSIVKWANDYSDAMGRQFRNLSREFDLRHAVRAAGVLQIHRFSLSRRVRAAARLSRQDPRSINVRRQKPNLRRQQLAARGGSEHRRPGVGRHHDLSLSPRCTADNACSTRLRLLASRGFWYDLH